MVFVLDEERAGFGGIAVGVQQLQGCRGVREGQVQDLYLL